jgi:hypothetical protein
MAKGYSKDLRERAVAMVEEGESPPVEPTHCRRGSKAEHTRDLLPV